MTTATSQQSIPHGKSWYIPTFSPEYGVYVVLLVSFLTGVAFAGQWNWKTTLALIFAFAGFQAEYPLTLQIKQRRSWKPQFLVWGGLYAGIALGIAGYLFLQTPMLLWLYLGAIAFGVALLKLWFIVWRLAWYKTTKIQNVATLETVSAILLSLLIAVIPLPGCASAAA